MMKILDRITVLVSLAALLLSGCSDWTRPEKLDFSRLTPEEADPEQYAMYLEDIKAYKETEHNVMIVGMEGISSHPSSQCQHIMAMPDSADYIVVRMGESLHENIAVEIPEVLQKKGTKTLLMVDYAEILAAWNILEDEKVTDGKEPGTDEEAEEYFRQGAVKLLENCNRYGFSGVMVSFTGTKQQGFATSSQTGFINAVMQFHSDNPDKELLFRGNAMNVIEKNFLEGFKYVVIVTGENRSLAMLPNRIIGRGSPLLDRVIFEHTVPSSENPEQLGMSPAEAAGWLVSTSHRDYEPKGLSVENAHDDYFNKEMEFKNIRSAISLMNQTMQDE